MLITDDVDHVPYFTDEEAEVQRWEGACPDHTGYKRQRWNSNPAIIAPCLLNILFFVTVFQQALFYIIFLLNTAIEVGVEIVINMVNHWITESHAHKS